MTVKLIGLVGSTRAGKTTLAKYLTEKYGYFRLSMSDPIKRMLAGLGLSDYDLNGPQDHRSQPLAQLCGKSPRQALQTLGTDWGRRMIGPEIWSNAMELQIKDKLTTLEQCGQEARLIVEDLRFPNDWKMLISLSGVIVRVRRPSVECSRTFVDVVNQSTRRYGEPYIRILGLPLLHESEYHWPDAPAEFDIFNTRDISSFHAEADKLLCAMSERQNRP